MSSAREAAQDAQPFWAALPLGDRARYLRRAAQVVLDVASELSAFLVREHPRTPAEAWALELLPSVDALHWSARAGQRALAPQRVRPHTPLTRLRRTQVVRTPLGVAGVRGSVRAPWAWPMERVGVALMAGNGVLIAPSPAAERMVRVWERAGVPDGLVALAGDGDLDALRRVWDDAAAGLERKGPMLVRADADVGRAAAAAARGAFGAGGRLPAGVAWAWVAQSVAEPFAARIRARAPAGAEILPPGSEPPREEPAAVLGITAVQGDEEAIAGAGALPRGGGASVWSRDADRARRIARALNAPGVWVNDHAAPIRPRSYGGFEEATRPAVLAQSTPGGPMRFWPTDDPGLPRALAAAGTLLYGRDADRAAALRDGARPAGRLLARALRRS